jgi:preprotein translocase subunit SecY
MRVLLNIWNLPQLRRKIIFTALLIVIFRLIAYIPLPGVDVGALRGLFSSSQIFQLLDLFSGGTLFNFSIITLGLNPYINSSIIMQLLTNVVPRFEELQKEGEFGRQKINQYTRYLTVPLAFLQSVGVLLLLRQSGGGIVAGLTPLEIITILVTMSAGTMVLMWMGELITEYGIGNGISILIFAGILARLPAIFGQTATIVTGENILNIVLILLLALIVIAGVVLMNEGYRKVIVQYAKRVRGNRLLGGNTTHLPIRVNTAGVIPIIFAVSIVLFPGMIATFFSTAANPAIASFANNVKNFFDEPRYYSGLYFILVIIFSYFYTSVTFRPDKIADDLRKYGGFVPGIRPGKATSDYLSYIINRITLIGGVSLGFIAVLPFLINEVTTISNLAIGGTGLLIAVSVVLETSKQIKSQMIMGSYEGFLR